MAEPLSIIAKISIEPSVYKRYLQSKSVKKVIEELFFCIQLQTKDAYCWQYNKKKQELICFALYDHGNVDTLKGSFYTSLKASLNPEFGVSSGFIATTMDGLNWKHLHSYEKYNQDKGWETLKKADIPIQEVWNMAINAIDKIEQPYAYNYTISTIIDASITKKVTRLQ